MPNLFGLEYLATLPTGTANFPALKVNIYSSHFDALRDRGVLATLSRQKLHHISRTSAWQQNVYVYVYK